MKKNNTEKIILGIDPGTNVMGYGVIRIMGNKAELVVMGVIDMRKEKDPYLRLGKIFERVTGIIDSYLPDEMAIEAPFFGKNVQSMLKLGRAQGVAIAAAIHHDVPIHEYAPLKIKMAITGQGQIIVDCFWFSEDTDITACLRSITGKFAHRIHGIISADIEKPTNIHFFKFFKKSRVNWIFQRFWKLITAGAEVGTRSMSKPIEFIARKSFFEIKNTVI